MDQPTFLAQLKKAEPRATADVIGHALGEFQARGKVLAGRELPLDRLLGALNRASETLGVEMLTDEQAARGLEALGAEVRRLPSFIAKHPFKITVQRELAERLLIEFREFESRTQAETNETDLVKK